MLLHQRAAQLVHSTLKLNQSLPLNDSLIPGGFMQTFIVTLNGDYVTSIDIEMIYVNLVFCLTTMINMKGIR